MNTTMMVLTLIMYVIVVVIVILNIKILKLTGRYVQYAEFLSKKNQNHSHGEVEEIPHMKLTSVLNDKFELSIDDQLKKNLLLVFLSPGCQPCKEVYLNLKNNININKITTMVISSDLSLDKNKEYIDHFKKENINFVIDDQVYKRLKVNSFPYMMHIDKNRKVLEQGHPGKGEEIYRIINNYNAAIN